MIKYYIYYILFISLAIVLPAEAQSSGQLAFNQAASLFIEGKNEEALQRVNSGLQIYPDDEKLQTLKEKLEEQKKQQEQQQQEQENKEGKDKEQQEGEKKEGEDKEGEKKEGEENSEESKEGEEQENNKEQEEGENKEGEDKEGKEQEGEKEEGQEEQPSPGEMDTQKRLEEMEISPEKARMILEAMKSNEVQYLQQKKRKQSKRSGNSDRPDW